MKLGVLETGRPVPALEQRFGRYDAMFRDLLGSDFEWTRYDAQAGELPSDPQEQDAYIVTGSPAGVYDDLPWIAPLIGFLQSAKGKARLVGICFGHQVMAEAFGGRVTKSELGWGIGLQSYHVYARAAWMDEATHFSIPVSHQDQVVDPPPHTRVLAGSDFNSFGLLEYKDQPAISFQCHPEFDPAYAKALIESRRERLQGVEEALASLDGPNDRPMVAGWIRRFLRGEAA